MRESDLHGELHCESDHPVVGTAEMEAFLQTMPTEREGRGVALALLPAVRKLLPSYLSRALRMAGSEWGTRQSHREQER